MQDTFNSACCRVSHADGAVLIQWKKFCRLDDYRAPALFALELLRRHAGSQLIIDARDGFEDDPADVAWAFSTLLPAMAKTDCRAVVLIMREVSGIEDEMDLWSREFRKYFAVRRVASYAEALNYLKLT